MVGHQTIANQQYSVQLQALRQQIQIDAAMGIVFENKPTSITALRHMVGKIQTDHASQTSHAFLPFALLTPKQPARRQVDADGSVQTFVAIMSRRDEFFLHSA